MNTDIVPTLTLTANKGETLHITSGPDTHTSIPFRMIGTGKMKNNTQSVNLLEEMETLSKSAMRLLNTLINNVLYDNDTKLVNVEVCYVPKTNVEKLMVKRGYKELNDRNLVRRSKRSHYVINPYALVTKNSEHIPLWESAQQNKM